MGERVSMMIVSGTAGFCKAVNLHRFWRGEWSATVHLVYNVTMAKLLVTSPCGGRHTGPNQWTMYPGHSIPLLLSTANCPLNQDFLKHKGIYHLSHSSVWFIGVFRVHSKLNHIYLTSLIRQMRTSSLLQNDCISQPAKNNRITNKQLNLYACIS